MPKFRDFSPGERLPAEWLNTINNELKRLGRIRGENGIEVSSNKTGIHIRQTLTQGTALILAKAKVEEGDYPTLLEWSESGGGLSTKQTEWQFVKGASDATGDDENPVDPYQDFVVPDEPEYITAYNLCRYHYVPENTICYLWKVNGSWYFDYSMSERFATLRGVIQGTPSLNTEHVTCSVFGFGSSQQCRFYAPEQNNVFMNGDIVWASLTPSGATDIRYEIIATATCPSPPPEDEEEEGGE